jgi:hypothetical protein
VTKTSEVKSPMRRGGKLTTARTLAPEQDLRLVELGQLRRTPFLAERPEVHLELDRRLLGGGVAASRHDRAHPQIYLFEV